MATKDILAKTNKKLKITICIESIVLAAILIANILFAFKSNKAEVRKNLPAYDYVLKELEEPLFSTTLSIENKKYIEGSDIIYYLIYDDTYLTYYICSFTLTSNFFNKYSWTYFHSIPTTYHANYLFF